MEQLVPQAPQDRLYRVLQALKVRPVHRAVPQDQQAPRVPQGHRGFKALQVSAQQVRKAPVVHLGFRVQQVRRVRLEHLAVQEQLAL